MDDDGAPALRPRYGVIKEPSLVLHIAADLIRPYNNDTIELAVLGLLHSQCRQIMHDAAAMLSAKCYVSGNNKLDVRSVEFCLS